MAGEAPLVRKIAGGDTLEVGSGGKINLLAGAKLQNAGVDMDLNAAGVGVTNSVAGVAAGYMVARGESALDASNPTPIASGLTSIVAVVATLKGSVAPGVGTCLITAVISGTTINFYGWKPTSNADPTLIASTGTASFYWIAVGT